MSDPFYRAFEDKFRGSRQEILRRLQVYLPFVKPLTQHYPGALVLDLGCGRGEWLELLRDQHVSAHGVDLDEGMLGACHDAGLSVETAEAIEFLSRQETSTAVAVTAFHLVEHIGFDALRRLVTEALRVLKPGGLLIMETPNPENLVVATYGFHLDPSHDKPIPPALLAFVAEYAGYEKVKILRLQESPEVLENSSLSLNDVLSGASPDYAVVAQKHSTHEERDLLQHQFDRTYGVNSAELAERYRHQGAESHAQTLAVSKKSQQLTEQLQTQSQARFDAMQVQFDSLADYFGGIEGRFRAIQGQFDVMRGEIHSAQVQSALWSQELRQVYASRSWKITKPLRWAALQQRRLSEQGAAARLKALLKKAGRPVWQMGVNYLSRHPAVRMWLIRWSKKLGLYESIVGKYSNPSKETINAAESPSVVASSLTPNARRIHTELKNRLAQKGDQ